MNKAFTKEEDEAPIVVPPRAPLPPGAINYVTARGLRQLHDELERLQAQRKTASESPILAPQPHQQAAFAERIAELEGRIASAVVVAPAVDTPDVVRFGARVQVRHEDDRTRSYQIVGVDEADAALGLIGFGSPVARALLGKAMGDVVTVVTPRGSEELEILAVSYDPLITRP